MCDRSAIVLCNMQMGFIEFAVAPLIIAFVQLFPTLHELGSNMRTNFQLWGDRRKGEILADEKITTDKSVEIRKLDERCAKFTARLSFLDALTALPRRRRLSSMNNMNSPSSSE
eukprot:gene43297-53753_t